jgi:transcriptional regulator with XRE-family HTH domain
MVALVALSTVGSSGPKPFGTLLREVRHTAGLTQEDLAAASGLSVRAISDLECGRARYPHFRSVRLLADALKVADNDRAALINAGSPDQADEPPRRVRQAWPPICQLPAPVPDFLGREADLAQAREFLGVARDRPAVPVLTISGLPGAGKTALALQLAHALRPSFPDGQLYLEFAASTGTPRDPRQLLGELVTMLPGPAHSVPETTRQHAALYRSLLADRRLLVVADDVACADQLRPVLPGTAGCAVIATSRKWLGELDGVNQVQLAPLDEDEAVKLLGHVAGRVRIEAEPAQVRRLISASGTLPLAIRILGAKLAIRPDWSLARLADVVADERRRLDALATGALAVRPRIESCYEALTDPARRAYRSLALTGPHDVAEWVVGALADTADAACVVDTLMEQSVLSAAGTDPLSQPRYRMYPLLRCDAAERLAQVTNAERHQVLNRLLTCYFALARLACGRVCGHRLRRMASPADHGRIPAGLLSEDLTGRVAQDPAGWFSAEKVNLLALAGQADAAGMVEAAAGLQEAVAGLATYSRTTGILPAARGQTSWARRA